MDYQIIDQCIHTKTTWSLNNNYCQTLVVLGDVRDYVIDFNIMDKNR